MRIRISVSQFIGVDYFLMKITVVKSAYHRTIKRKASLNVSILIINFMGNVANSFTSQTNV